MTLSLVAGKNSERKNQRMKQKQPTIRDVAARAGVSHQTVSRVINGDASVRPGTRALVQKAIEDMKYVPNPMARGLISNRTHCIGMVTTNVSDHSFAEAVAGAEKEARRLGYFLMVASVEEDDSDDGGQYLRLLVERRIEGLILARAHPVPGQLKQAEENQIPTVIIGPQVDGHAAVDVDNVSAAKEAVSHLLSRGHRRIAMITGPSDWPSVQSRIRGYDEACAEWGVKPHADLIEHAIDWSPMSGQAAAARLLARDRSFTAVFAHSDLLAVGAIREFGGNGVDVPNDVSIVGFDDIEVAAFANPPLTTVRQPMEAVGALAASLVIGQLGNGSVQQKQAYLLPGIVIPRESVVPVKRKP
jgi:DNA-binding LacI/PurR family transcriptional regulator